MPAITQFVRQAGRVTTITPVTLNGTDTFTYQPGSNQWLLLKNPTGGAISPKLVGSTAPSAYSAAGLAPVDLTTGFTIGSIAAGGTRALFLDDVAPYLAGACTVTTGTGLEAYIVTDH